jgi:hypothetical protein
VRDDRSFCHGLIQEESVPTSTADPLGTSSRRFVHPQPGDTLETIARRELAHVPAERAAEQLLSWNLHLANRLVGKVSGVIGCDIVYVEAPRNS